MSYPVTEPFNEGFLKVSDLHTIHYEEVGNPKGPAIVFLHGGPGGGISAKHRQFFDPKYFRAILFSQRGCGRSTPFAELRENTTWDLVSDIEKLRQHLKIDQWHVFGGSWGSTLALAYSQKHPQSCLSLTLRGIFLCRKSEIDWFYQEGASHIFPDEFERYLAPIPESERKDLVTAYYKRLTGTDEKTKLKAAQAWSRWESATWKLLVDEKDVRDADNAEFALPFARIECHYFYNRAFFETDNYLIENVKRIEKIPTRILHGRYDVVCPLSSAWDLKQALPKASLEILPTSGHSAFEPDILRKLCEYTDALKR